MSPASPAQTPTMPQPWCSASSASGTKTAAAASIPHMRKRVSPAPIRIPSSANTAPDWPGQAVPQQMHLDVIVEDLDAGEAAVLELGATKHDHQPGKTFRMFLDPAGHPFCLCVE